jgi:hypothetical protein
MTWQAMFLHEQRGQKRESKLVMSGAILSSASANLTILCLLGIIHERP